MIILALETTYFAEYQLALPGKAENPDFLSVKSVQYKKHSLFARDLRN